MSKEEKTKNRNRNVETETRDGGRGGGTHKSVRVCPCVFLLAGESVSADDGGGVDLLLHQFICTLQQLCSNDHLHTHAHFNIKARVK